MEAIEGRTIRDEIISLDDKCFIDCTLIRCTLKYSGGPVILERTQLTGCRYVFFGKAKASVHFLQCVGLMPHVDARWKDIGDPADIVGQMN